MNSAILVQNKTLQTTLKSPVLQHKLAHANLKYIWVSTGMFVSVCKYTLPSLYYDMISQKLYEAK